MSPLAIGDTRIASIIERDGPWRSPAAMFPGVPAGELVRVMAEVPAFAYDRAQDLLVITYQTFVVRTPQCTVLIDTCVGEHARRPERMQYDKRPWLDGFAQNGLKFEDIDYVFCTHLHVDHVGWNTRLENGRLVPTFPNAKYVFSRREFAYWKDEADASFGPIFEDCVEPVVAAGQALLVDDAYVLNDQMRLVPTAGHSPGHVCVEVRSGKERALFTGDMMHHCAQCIAPEWSTCFCYDGPASSVTRRRIFSEYGGEDTLFLPTHFPAPTAGHVVPYRDTWRFRFLGT